MHRVLSLPIRSFNFIYFVLLILELWHTLDFFNRAQRPTFSVITAQDFSAQLTVLSYLG